MGNLVMFYDTETTGKTDFKAPYNAQTQPNLVQLGYKVVEPLSREVIFEVGHLVDTTGFTSWTGIEPDAQVIHGIDEMNVRTYGFSPDQTLENWTRWAEACSLFIAHNDQFDTGVMQCFAFRSGWNPGLVFGDARKFCTMKFTTNICKLPSPNGMGFKWPKLNEAYPFFHNGTQFSGAHNALADVNACASIFWKLADAEIIKFDTGGLLVQQA